MNNLKLLPVITLMLLAQSVKAQFSNVSVHFGPNMRSARGNYIIETVGKSAVGWNVGLSTDFNITDKFSINSGLFYDRKGAIYDVRLSNEFGQILESVDIVNNVDILSIPVLARFTFGEKIQVFGNVGPYLGLVVHASNVIPETEINEKIKSNNLDEYNRFEFGLSAGLGMKIPFSDKWTGNFEIRNNLGLSSLYDEPDLADYEYYTNSLNLMLGVGYKFGN